MLTRVLTGVIRAYQVAVSPVLPSSCRFTPSCSEYARQAIERHGPARGTWLAFRRIGRCHPLGRSGYDPVPDGDAATGNPPGTPPVAGA